MVGASEGLEGEELGSANSVSSGVPEPDEWSPPEEFDEYRLVRLLGRGSMGQVFLAHDRVLDRPVAIKFISSLKASTRERERFLVEARAAARLHHPNIMTMYRVGELDGSPYLVCEFIRGKSLHELVLPITWQRAHEIAIKLARGLANAHRRGVLHRDIKLANVMIDEVTGEVKILDFSLAKLMRDPEPSSVPSGRSQSLPATGAVIRDCEEDDFEEDAASPAVSLSPEAGQGVAKTEEVAEGSTERGDVVNPARRLEVSALPPGVIARITALDAEWRGETMLARLANRLQGPSESDDTGPGDQVSQEQQAAPGWLSEAGASPSLTKVGALMGTPHYMASELWHGEPGSRASDVYAVGVVLYALVVGSTPYAGLSLVELATAVLAGSYRPIQEAAPGVDPRFASIIERCLRTQPGERYTSGEALRSALEILTPRGRDRQLPTGNPYRGLQAFQAEHRSLFFGRSVEIRAVVERLRADAFVLVAGDSGVGKSSLCRAGVLPLMLDGAIEPERAWVSLAMMPGRKPLQVLVSTLAGYLEIDEEVIHGMIQASAVAFGWYLRKRLGKNRGLVIFIDQLEELVTISDRKQAAVVGEVLSQIAAGIPGVRLLASARGDFLTRVAEIPELGEEIARAIYLLRPLTRASTTEAITGPAELQGVRFASEELVCELVDAGIDGSLPLLQFALAELWSVRDTASGMITRADLERIGGVTGALARHGDGVLASLLPKARGEARRILVRLVTIDDTRANLSEGELTLAGDGDANANTDTADARTALEALVRTRLLVVRESAEGIFFEIAHEALIGGWGTLRGWLDEEREGRILLHSLETASSEWERLGKPRDALWGTAALTRAGLYLDSDALRPRESDFLRTSRRARARGRRLRRAAMVVIPLLLAAVYGGVKLQEYQVLQDRVAARIREAGGALAAGRRVLEVRQQRRVAAFASFDSMHAPAGEDAWVEVVKLTALVDRHLKESLQSLEAAQILDPQNKDAHQLIAEVLYERARLAEQEHQQKQAEEFRERLELYDRSGEYVQRWEAPGGIAISVHPVDTDVSIGRYTIDENERYVLGEMRVLGRTPLAEVPLDQGSYLLRFASAGVSVNYPVIVQRNEIVKIEFSMPDLDMIPEGFVYVPPGRFLFGSADSETMRKLFFYASPQHSVTTEGYLIGREEVSFAQWIEFLEALPEAERAALLPNAEGVKLEQVEGEWVLTFGAGGEAKTAAEGASIVFGGRSEFAEQEWTRWPVVGLSVRDAQAYVEWLGHTGRLPEARLCTGTEWERAVRGADGRSFGHGNNLRAEDANFQQTFGFGASVLGPVAIGSFAVSRTPFGLYNSAGNAVEWVASANDVDEFIIRGGAFPYDSIQGYSYNRGVVPEGFRDWSSGMRVCVSYSELKNK